MRFWARSESETAMRTGVYALHVSVGTKGCFAMQNPILESTYLPNLEAYMDRATALELARRSLLGAPVYTFVSLIMLAGTPMLVDYGPWAATEAVLLIFLACVLAPFGIANSHLTRHYLH